MFLDDQEKEKRKNFYRENNIGWIARPKENRKGRFKKASNMNYAINFSKKYTENLLNSTMENSSSAMIRTLENYKNECDAENDVTIGDFILLIDSDTIVPESCLFDTIGEFKEQKLAFTQHLTTPMEEPPDKQNYWDKTICHFTRMIYELAFIQVTAGGDPSPLVGHNAFIRMKCLEEVSYLDETNDKKYWNENTVCEDFDISLRFQSKGYYGRYITYTGKEFKEGVSPTYCDEIVRFKKYALGTGEITFNPFVKWYNDGIFSKTIKDYMKSSGIPWYSKILLLSYLCSYYIMAFSPLLLIITVLQLMYCDNCIASGLFEIWIGIIGIFTLFLPLSTAIFRYKLHKYTCIQKLHVIGQEYFYGLRMGLFFGSLGVHMLFSICTYMFNLDEIFLSSRKEKPSWGQLYEYLYILKSYWRVFLFVVIFDMLYVVNYIFNDKNYYNLISPCVLTFLHIAIPFLYS
jgi:hypothetical protein